MLIFVKRIYKPLDITYTMIYPASIVTVDFMNSLMEDNDYITTIEFR